ncbi:glycosyltransferase [Pelagibius litoralis]|uniref:Glycosyltransferase n=1 Tax=Pelagibius litoralis TaxID=374515 RepID=A0A967F1T3_9PROT|nr:glycosyltransferase [Pelagibius litoralis]NIA71365.1 glycosyltransferase [Pelagibius litoralis]
MVVGKFPPLQGGVSTIAYFSALDALDNGHEVIVVTNSAAAVPTNRVAIDPPKNFDAGGKLRLVASEPVAERAFIPWAAPHCAQLTGLTHSMLRSESVDLVVGWYLYPYGLAAAFACLLDNKPFGLIHAGTDLARLSRYRDLRSCYEAIIPRAACIVSAGDDATRLLNRMGARSCQLLQSQPNALARQRIVVEREEMDEIVASFDYRSFYADSGTEIRNLFRDYQPPQTTFTSELPVIAIFGKAHVSKGHHFLVEALSQIQRMEPDIAFRFLLCVSGDEQHLNPILDALNGEAECLLDRTLLMPIVHPLMMPSLLGMCDILCILDHCFPVCIHQPRLLREGLRAGSSILCSAESAKKSGLNEHLVKGKNCEMVTDPSDIDELRKALLQLLRQRNHRRQLAYNGKVLSRVLEKSLGGRRDPISLVAAAFKRLGALE